VATGLQTHKQINNRSTVSKYRSQYLVIWGEEEAKASFAVPLSSPVGCGTLSTGKRRLIVIFFTFLGSSSGKLILFFGLSETTVFVSCFIIDYNFLNSARYSFTLCWKTHFDLCTFLSVSLLLIPLRISVFHFFTCQEMCSYLSPDKLTNILSTSFT